MHRLGADEMVVIQHQKDLTVAVLGGQVVD